MKSFFLLGILMLSLAWAQPSRIIRIHVDQSAGDPFHLLELVQQEIEILTEGRYNIDFRIQAWPAEAKYDTLADLTITLGTTSSQAMLQQKTYLKPVIIGTVIDRQLQNIPVTESTSSGVKNLNYIQNPFDFDADIELFREIRPFRKLAMLVDKQLFGMVSVLAQNVSGVFLETESYELVPVSDESPDELLAKLPEDCDAVYLLPIGGSFGGEMRGTMLDSLSGAGLPTFAMLGSEWTEAGAMASRAAQQSGQILARRIALNTLAILGGQDAGDLTTEVATIEEDFVINMAAVFRSEVYPGWDALAKARLINIDENADGPVVNLRGIVGEALANNLSYNISQLETSAGEQDVRLALAELLPEITLSSSFTAIDQARAEASFGSTQPLTWAANAQLSQVLFAEPLYANLRIQKLLQASRVASQEQTELDVVLEACEAYFNVLQANAILRLQNQNVDNTRINFNLAEKKESVGYSGATEVYRWESQLALNKIDLNDAQASLRSAKFRLNQILNRSQTEFMNLDKTELGDSLLSILDFRLMNYISDPGQVEKVANFYIAEGFQNLPELRQIELSLQAQERLLKSRDREFYLPTLALSTSTGYNIYQGGLDTDGAAIDPMFEGLLPDPITDPTWTVGLSLNFPVFQGNARKANKEKATIDLARLRSQRKDVQNQFELAIRSGLQRASASFAEIELSATAAEAGRKNLEIARDGYREGIVPIAQLIDAQEAALQTEILATNAVYNFLLDFLSIERSIGFFYFLATPEEQTAFFERARQYLK